MDTSLHAPLFPTCLAPPTPTPSLQERLRNPVVAADGFTYERAAIQNWLSTRDTSPMTNDPLEDKVGAGLA